MKPVWTIVITVLLTAGIIGGGTYFYLNSQAKQDKNELNAQIDDLNRKLTTVQNSLVEAEALKTTATTTTDSAEAATTTDNSEAWRKYSNTTYGFSLTFPNDTWKNYVINTKLNPDNNSATAYIYFCIPSTVKTWTDSSCKSTGYGGPFAVGVYTQAQWSTIAVEDTPASASKVAENSNYIFTLSHWQDGPTDLTGADLGLSSITSSFKAN